mgnify:CR=1 FL=1
MKKTLEGILENCIDFGFGYGLAPMKFKDKKRYILQSRQEIKALLMEKMPKKKLTYEHRQIKLGNDYIKEVDARYAGFNDSIDDFTNLISGL